MLLEIDNSELLHMLEHNESLKAKVFFFFQSHFIFNCLLSSDSPFKSSILFLFCMLQKKKKTDKIYGTKLVMIRNENFRLTSQYSFLELLNWAWILKPDMW